MAKVIIHKLGPIDDCTMDIEHFTILTGAQASGKSTIAKCVFFCRTIKDDICEIILKRMLLGSHNILFYDVLKVLRSKFLQMFGTSKAMDRHMKLTYYYSSDTYIRITLKMQEGYDYISPNYVWIDFSKDLELFLRSYENTNMEAEALRNRVNTLFHDDYESIFIPAGRSLITLLTSQLNYLFTTMDDEQKRSIDFCTQKYIERILKIRPLFDQGIEGLINQKKNTPGIILDYKAIDTMRSFINKVLKGNYMYKDSEERLYIDKEHFVKINYTSSGQQETVWIFNILLHIMIHNKKAFIILEEPEAHLYPQAQKSMVDILSLIGNKSCSVMMTTHSPYILGELNNLIYAANLSKKPDIFESVNKIVKKVIQIERFNAYFLEHGNLQPCIEPAEDGGLIINEVIDGASLEINKLYDQLFDVEYGRNG